MLGSLSYGVDPSPSRSSASSINSSRSSRTFSGSSPASSLRSISVISSKLAAVVWDSAISLARAKFPPKLASASSRLPQPSYSNINNQKAYVSDVVLSATDETTFIQTLGRIRIFEDNPKINLYIEYYDAKRINGIRHTYYEKLRFLSFFKNLNAYKVFFNTWKGVKTRRKIKPQQSDDVIKYLVSKMQDVNGDFINLLVCE